MISKRLAGLIVVIAGQTMVMSDSHAAGVGASLSTGRATYEKFCAACHGGKGEGEKDWQRRNGFGELPAPPHDATGHTWKHADGMLYRIVLDGWRDPFNKSHRLTMPAYKDVLKPDEIRDVIDFLKTMWTPAQREAQRAESRAVPFPSEASEAIQSGPTAKLRQQQKNRQGGEK